MTTRRDIEAFLALKRIAVVGVSRQAASYSRMVFRELRSRGYDVVPVHPQAAQIEGIPCARTLADVNPPPEAALILTNPGLYGRLAEEAKAAGAAALWFRQKAPPVEGVAVVSGECPMMWLRGAGWIHRFHRSLRRWAGTLPG
ncbi:MAG: CoA-binding protein [Bryobacteraceae bacterium]|nr:CoA-binding protein [Bryobacteraceae bacterium]MCX7604341.1 CoA-binding protein [Bryobacteraceae bacterium]